MDWEDVELLAEDAQSGFLIAMASSLRAGDNG